MNRRFYRANDRFDRKFFRPAALGYKHVVPNPLRTAIRHFFSNLSEPIVFVNYLLQLKPGKAVETATRFVINSTVGLGGVIDVARSRDIKLPHRPNGFGDTLGVYGVKPGPYLYLPFIGPTDVRDLLGGQVDGLVLPLSVGKPFDQLKYQIPRAVVTGLDQRAEADDDLKAMFAGAVDPYATLRSVYLQDRQAEIAQIKGNARAAKAPPAELDDALQDPAGARPSADPKLPDAPELQDPLTDPAAPAPIAG